MKLIVAGLAALALAACGGNDDGSGDTNDNERPAESQAIACTDMVDQVLTVEIAKEGTCVENPDTGDLLTGWATQCADGSYLAQIKLSDGEAWAVTGKPWTRVSEAASDPGYGAAFAAC